MRKMAAMVALLFAPVAGAAFKCVDEHGQRAYGDTPPAACATVPMDEVTPSGRVIRTIEPTPTPQQLKARQEEAGRRLEAQRREAEQRRHDNALLATFASEKEFDVARDRNIEPLTGRVHIAEERLKEIDKRLAKIDEEMEFYKAGGKGGKAREVPHSYIAEQDRLGKERQALVRSVAASEKEIVAQRERFERDKKRWVELRNGAGTQPVADRK